MSKISKLEQNLIIKKIDKETTNIYVFNNEMLISIAGQFDENLKHLSKLTYTNVFFGETQLYAKAILKMYLFFVRQ